MKILLVDDNDYARRNTRKFFENKKADIEFLEAATGEEAIEMLQNNRIDWMFLDLHLDLSDVDGYDVLEAKAKIAPFTKTIVISGGITEHVTYNVITKGATTIFPKPLDLEGIYNYVLSK